MTPRIRSVNARTTALVPRDQGPAAPRAIHRATSRRFSTGSGGDSAGMRCPHGAAASVSLQASPAWFWQSSILRKRKLFPGLPGVIRGMSAVVVAGDRRLAYTSAGVVAVAAGSMTLGPK